MEFTDAQLFWGFIKVLLWIGGICAAFLFIFNDKNDVFWEVPLKIVICVIIGFLFYRWPLISGITSAFIMLIGMACVIVLSRNHTEKSEGTPIETAQDDNDQTDPESDNIIDCAELGHHSWDEKGYCRNCGVEYFHY